VRLLMNTIEEIIYFEVNNWFCGRDYPDCEPFISWLRDDLNQTLRDEQWIKENKLVVFSGFIDMSMNYYVAAPKSWVLKNCSCLLDEKYKKFLLTPDEEGYVEGRFGPMRMPYDEDTVGKLFWVEEYEDNDGYIGYRIEDE